MNGRLDPQQGNCATAKLGNRLNLAVIMKRIDAFSPEVNTPCSQEVASR